MYCRTFQTVIFDKVLPYNIEVVANENYNNNQDFFKFYILQRFNVVMICWQGGTRRESQIDQSTIKPTML